MISIHAPAKGATGSRAWPRRKITHFNPRSREGSDGSVLSDNRGVRPISIHAPAKGATPEITQGSPTLSGISIHAPAKGATMYMYIATPSKLISIHAPAKGATNPITSFSGIRTDFNPRSREGSDGPTVSAKYKSAEFQSTLPRRERPGVMAGGT